jgi:hypothetical protein
MLLSRTSLANEVFRAESFTICNQGIRLAELLGSEKCAESAAV